MTSGPAYYDDKTLALFRKNSKLVEFRMFQTENDKDLLFNYTLAALNILHDAYKAAAPAPAAQNISPANLAFKNKYGHLPDTNMEKMMARLLVGGRRTRNRGKKSDTRRVRRTRRQR